MLIDRRKVPSTQESWLCALGPARGRVRLVCFPYAGGSPSVFHGWRQTLPEEVSLYGVHLPGRSRRIVEKPVETVEEMVDATVQALNPHLSAPLVFFGHSMGAVLAFEVARMLRRRAGIEPAHLILAGYVAPQLPRTNVVRRDLSDSALKDKLRELGGTPPEILDDPRMMDMLLPSLRADFNAIGAYQFRPEPPLSCPITTIAGDADTHCSPAEIEQWRVQTRGEFTTHVLHGGHFFIQSAAAPLQEIIAEIVQRY